MGCVVGSVEFWRGRGFVGKISNQSRHTVTAKKENEGSLGGVLGLSARVSADLGQK